MDKAAGRWEQGKPLHMLYILHDTAKIVFPDDLHAKMIALHACSAY